MVKSLLTYLIVAFSFVSSAQEESNYTVNPVQLTINGDVYSPAFMDSLLVICGTRKDRVFHTHLDKNNKEPIDLYVLNVDSANSYSRFDEKFRSDFHDGPISFNQSANHCVVSRNLRLDKRFKSVQADENHLGLFESRFENNEWTLPEALLVNSKEYNCTHPALSENGETLVFSSNMPGGFGGYDLWKIEKSDGKWGEPENLGSGVNTSGNEFFPNWIGSTIYFSANRQEFGGLDVYQVDGMGKSATTRILEKPLNSEFDDFGFISRTQGKTGYFSSNRSGADALWSFEMLFPRFDDCDSIVSDDFCYTLLEETAYELGGIESLIYQWDINGEQRIGYEIDYCFPGPGVYDIRVDIYDTLIKKVYANQASYTLELTLEEQPYITSPDSVQIGNEFALSTEGTYLPGVDIESYYWIFSDGTLFSTQNPNHTFETPGEYQVTLGIIGTKDGEPFKDCSYKYIVATAQPSQADAITLVKKDIGSFEEEGQIISGERPLIDSDSSLVVHSIEITKSQDPLSDTNDILAPAASSYIINALFDLKDSSYIYSVGEWLSVGEAHETWKDIVELGYEDAMIFTHKKDKLSLLSLNESFTLENIQFESNRWDIQESSKVSLQLVVLLLNEFKDVRLSINAHTDNIGKESDNLELSEKRAKSIMNYLTNAGIDISRLESKGFGESNPKYTNDTPEGRYKNRRVEFTIIPSEVIEIIPE